MAGTGRCNLDCTGRPEAGAAAGDSSGEVHYRSLVENTSDVLMVLDKPGILAYESPSVERTQGHLPTSWLAGPWAISS